MSTIEIICVNCGTDTLLKRETIYNGFTKAGEKRTCSSCGFEYASESEVPFKATKSKPQLFTKADRSAKIEVFDEDENQRICRYCASYTVNPFTQFCSIHQKEVQSTDSCGEFLKGGEKEDSPIL